MEIDNAILNQIHTHVEAAYPGEGAGFLLGEEQNGRRLVTAILRLDNACDASARHNRFLLTADDYARGEDEADRLGLALLGVFHSHPDCPNRPSEYDREWAMPWFSYLITRVDNGKAVNDLSWRLDEDRKSYTKESIHVIRET